MAVFKMSVDKAKTKARNWRYNSSAKGKANNNARKRRYRATERGKRSLRNRYLKKTYGLTLVEWEALFASQGSCCAACGGRDPQHARGWCTDHDHKTGRNRAILCHPCNLSVQDQFTPTRLRLLAEYLERHGSPVPSWPISGGPPHTPLNGRCNRPWSGTSGTPNG